MIALRNITVKFDKKVVLDNLSFEFKSGVKYALMGESGSGKTTILNAISRLIKFDGEVDVSQGEKISYVFQEPRLFDWLTVLENVSLVMDLPKDEAREKAKKLLYELGLEDSLDLYPTELSGGMKQRVSIARALAFEPTVLLLDEPFRALDADTKQKVASYVFDYMKNKTVIMVTHDDTDTSFVDTVLKVGNYPINEILVVKTSI